MRARDVFEYNKLTWPEMNDAIEMQKVVILPTGSTEQHGPHMPLDVDLFLVREVCHELGRRAPDQVLVLPAIPCGLNLHHMDFPGTIHIQPDHFINYCVDVTKSVAYHGFQRIAVVNGHGSNGPMVDLVARRTVLETPSICCAFGYFAMGKAEYEALLESTVHAHADEMETSLYLHFAKERVRLDKAVFGNDHVGQSGRGYRFSRFGQRERSPDRIGRSRRRSHRFCEQRKRDAECVRAARAVFGRHLGFGRSGGRHEHVFPPESRDRLRWGWRSHRRF